VCEDCSSPFTTNWAQRLCNPCRAVRASGYSCTVCGRKVGHSGRDACWQCFSGPTPPLSVMSSPELGWLAGIIEGEGYFGTTPRHGVVRVVMTDEDVIGSLRAVSGIGQVNELSRRAPHHRTPYAWSVAREPNVLALTQAIAPLLGQRRRIGASAVLALHGQEVPAERSLKPGSPEGWAWVAGLIEGEGWMGPGPGTVKRTPILAAESTDRDVIERIAALTDAARIADIRPRTPACKPSWRWSVCSRTDTRRILAAILPLLGRRRAERARYVLSQIG
jgi:hypothetical protein